MRTVLVAGAIANNPHNGGEAWIRLSWVLGLRRLGFRAVFVEQLEGGATALQVDLPWFRRIVEQFELVQDVALLDQNGKTLLGIPYPDLLALARSAELLVNISGHLTIEPLKSLPRRRAFIDEDPGYTQVWHAQGLARERLDGHHAYFTLGQNVGRADCAIPTAGIEWRPLLPPVVLDAWPVCPIARTDAAFTTVGNWRGAFGPLTHEGRTYGPKAHEFRKFIELPRRAGGVFEAALKIHASETHDITALAENRWRLVEPAHVAAEPFAFRDYVQNSYAEFSVAQGVYVDTNSGWFSDRTTRYLASGKPALVQETGFSRIVPTGEGLLAFQTMDEALVGVEDIRANYARHCRAARAIAEQYFDSDRVLRSFLEQMNVSP